MFKSKSPVGVDIGSHTVKVCQLRQTPAGFELERFGFAEIYPNGEQPTDPATQQSMKIAALKRALENGGIKAKHSVSAICGESIIVRYLQLPRMPEDELKKALQWEAEEYIPFRLTEVNIDSQVLGTANDGDGQKMDVLLVSAKKDMVAQHAAILRGAGLEPRVIDVDSFAFLNCFEVNYNPAPDETVALVNIGSEITSINICAGKVSRFSRDIPLGGDTLTAAIKSHLGCSFAEAEQLKIAAGAPFVDATVGHADTQQSALMDTIRGTVDELTQSIGESTSREAMAQQALAHSLANLVSEVRRSLEFVESQYRGLNVSRVILGGGTAALRNLREHFEKDLLMPVEVIDPLRRVSAAGKSPAQLDGMRHMLGVSIGLGIRGCIAA
jgi:type IV pilus assembly protein PilM